MTRKINKADFTGSKALREHAQRSREVARALDAQADALPHALCASASIWKSSSRS